MISTLRQAAPAKKIFRRLFFRGKHFARSTLAPLEDRVTAWRLPRARARIGLFTMIRAEQAPNPESRMGRRSAFPTPGWTNPTITVLALTMRLGGHLAGMTDWGRPTAIGALARPART